MKTRQANRTMVIGLLSLVMLCIALAIPAAADGPANPLAPDEAAGAYTVEPNATALLLMPELKGKKAPDWVKPGLRITFAGADGVTPGNNEICTPDGYGFFKTRDGKKFNVADVASGAGRGITQADVVAVHDDAVVLDIKASVFNGLGAILTLASQTGQTTTPSAAAGGWVHPDVLHKYLDLNSPGMTSTRITYAAAGKNYNAIWEQFSKEDSASCTIFDIDSGLLLHHSTFSLVPTKTVIGPGGNPIETGGQSYASFATLAGVRMVKTPWTQGRLPRAMQELHQLIYDGQVQTVIPGGLPVPPSTMHVELKVFGRGPDFIQIHRTGYSTIGGGRIPFASDLVSGPAQLMPVAVDPADLAKLQQGQELDVDPVTKIVTKVAFVGRDRSGQEAVALSQAIPGDNQQLWSITYDRASGVMKNIVLTNPFLHQVTLLSLTSKQ